MKEDEINQMPVIEKTVTTYSDECNFIKEFIKQLTEADNRITCSTDIDSEFKDTANRPNIIINFAGIFNLILESLESNNSSTWYYKINSTDYPTLEKQLKFTSQSIKKTDKAERTWNFKIISNEKMLNIIFGDYDLDISTKSTFNMILFLDDNDNYICSDTTSTEQTEILNNYVYKLNEIDNSLVRYNLNNCFNYIVTNNKIKTKKYKNLVNTNKEFHKSIPSIYDCSIIKPCQFYIIDNKKYYSINENTLCPI